jgi:ribonuclease HI
MKMAALIPSTSPFLLGVYRVTLSVEVRRKPDFSEHSRSGTTLQVGAIVSTIQKVRVRGVDFVRLEDNSGWVFTTSKAKNVVLKQLPIIEGTYVYKVINDGGLALRCMPDYRSQFKTEVYIEEGKFVASTHRVRGACGDWFPRIAGKGWLFESRSGTDTLKKIRFQKGNFAYTVQNGEAGLVARAHPDYDPDCILLPKTRYLTGAVVSGSVRVKGQFGDWFLKLDAGGWLFASREGSRTMCRCTVEEGEFSFAVNNGPAGLLARSMPDYSPKCVCIPESLYPSGTIVKADSRVRGEFGDWFVRIQNGCGWLFASRLGQETLVSIREPTLREGILSQKPGPLPTAKFIVSSKLRSSPIKTALSNETEVAAAGIERTMRVYFAGACSPSPGQGGCSAIGISTSYGEEGRVRFQSWIKLDSGRSTLKSSEYSGLILALKQLEQTTRGTPTSVEIVGSSDLIINHMNGLVNVSNGALTKYHRNALHIVDRLKKRRVFRAILFNFVPTIMNESSIALAQRSIHFSARKSFRGERTAPNETLSKMDINGTAYVVHTAVRTPFM